MPKTRFTIVDQTADQHRDKGNKRIADAKEYGIKNAMSYTCRYMFPQAENNSSKCDAPSTKCPNKSAIERMEDHLVEWLRQRKNKEII